MRSPGRSLGFVFIVCSIALASVAVPALGGSHSWAPWEFYSDATGTIQYVVLWNPTAPAENGIAARDLRTANPPHSSGDFGTNLPGNTADRYLLGATAAFAALPGAPTPDFPILIDDFFNTNGDTVTFWQYSFEWSSFTFGAGEVPNDGSLALRRDGYTVATGSVARGTPINYAGERFAPAGVSNSLLVEKITSNGGRLGLEWDDSGCLGTTNFQIIAGFGSGLPSSLGGSYMLQAANPLQQCAAASPDVWQGVPDPSVDPSRLLWFVVVANDSVNTEGSWGTDSAGNQRTGPGLGGASTQCGSMVKSLINSCGQ